MLNVLLNSDYKDQNYLRPNQSDVIYMHKFSHPDLILSFVILSKDGRVRELNTRYGSFAGGTKLIIKGEGIFLH